VILNAKDQTSQKKATVFEGLVKDCVIEPQSHYVKEIHVNIPPELEPSITLGILVMSCFFDYHLHSAPGSTTLRTSSGRSCCIEPIRFAHSISPRILRSVSPRPSTP
jgi:hypothetical protein